MPTPTESQPAPPPSQATPTPTPADAQPRSCWLQATAPALPTDAQLEAFRQQHKVVEMRWCAADGAGGVHLFLRRPKAAYQSSWMELCRGAGLAYVPPPEDGPLGRAPWRRFAEQAGGAQAGALAVNVQRLDVGASQRYGRPEADPEQAAADKARRAALRARREEEVWARVDALLPPSPGGAPDAEARRAEALLDALHGVTPQAVPAADADDADDAPPPPPPSPPPPPATPFDRFLDGQGAPPSADPVEAGDAAMQDLASSVKAHWEARGFVPTAEEAAPLRDLPLFADIAWPAAPQQPAPARPRAKRYPRKTLAQRVAEASLGIRRRGRPLGSKTVNRRPRAGTIWRTPPAPAEAEPAEPAPPASPPHARGSQQGSSGPAPASPPPHVRGSQQPTIREMLRRIPTTPSLCAPRARGVQYKPPYADMVRAFLAREDACAPEGGRALVELVHALLPERIRGHAEFNCNDPATAFGRLFPAPAPTYHSYLTAPGAQSPELTTVEAHRRALRLEAMAKALLDGLEWASVNRPGALGALPPPDRADLRAALEFAGGLRSGPLYWRGRPAAAGEEPAPPRGPEESALRPTLEFLRDHRARAFERTYLVADVQSWGLPILVGAFLAHAVVGNAHLLNEMTDLADVRLQVPCPCSLSPRSP
jgi:hypothetical protein